jgi:hypothetical protein
LISEAREAEADNNNAIVEIVVGNTAASNVVNVTISGSAVGQLAIQTDTAVSVSTGIGMVTFNAQAVDSISSDAGTANISIEIEKVNASTLTEQAQALIKDRPVYDFSVTAGQKQISSFGDGSAHIRIPYTLRDGEDPSAVVVYYIDDAGNIQTISGAYHANTGTVDFTTAHFSKYAVGYNEVTFTDVKDNDWYGDAVSFIAARGITAGTTAQTYSPEATLTRAQFLVMILRAYGIKPDEKPTDNFADAGNDYYTGYLASAKRLGIATGIGENCFAPAANISRQDMFTLLYRVLKVLNALPATRTGKLVSSTPMTSCIGM